MAPLVPKEGLLAWRAFLTAHARVVRLIEIELAEARGLPYVWYDVLVAIAEAPDRQLRMRDLANAMLLTRSNSTRLVDKIEAAGLLARVRTPADRRGTLATLTPAGLRVLRLAWPVYARGIREHFLAYLDKAELTVLRKSLSRVHEGAEKSRKPARRRRRATSKA